MKKSSTWMMLAPGLIILLLCLGLPLISVLTPTFTAGQYPLSAYVEFFQDEYYRKILFRTLKIAVITTGICMAGGIPTAYFISRCDKKWRGLLLALSLIHIWLFNVLGETIDGGESLEKEEKWVIHRDPPSFEDQSPVVEMLETGIKVIDLLAPYAKGGKIGLFGGAGVGTVSYTHLDVYKRQT